MIYIKHSPGVAPSLWNCNLFLLCRATSLLAIHSYFTLAPLHSKAPQGSQALFFFEHLKMTEQKSHIHNNINKTLFVLQDNPSKTASTLRGNFYLTGDRGYMDKDGYFWFVARSDDVILSSG